MDTWSEKVYTIQNYELYPVLESREKWSSSTLWIMYEPVLPGSLREVEREEGEEGQLSFYLTNADSSHHFHSTWSSSKNNGVGSHSLLQGNLPDPGIEPWSPALQADSSPSEPPGKPSLISKYTTIIIIIKMVWYENKRYTHRPMGQNWEPRNKHVHIWRLLLKS